MGTNALISMAEYMHTSYEPEARYVDRVVVERTAGLRPHSRDAFVTTNPEIPLLLEEVFRGL